jgi:hypothetical protein
MSSCFRAFTRAVVADGTVEITESDAMRVLNAGWTWRPAPPELEARAFQYAAPSRGQGRGPLLKAELLYQRVEVVCQLWARCGLTANGPVWVNRRYLLGVNRDLSEGSN